MAYPSGPPPAPPAQAMGSTNTVFITETRLDLSYVVTTPGVIKAALVVLNLLCFICIESSAFRSNGRGVYFVFVSLVGLVFSGGLLLAYLYHVVEKYHNFKWLKVEMVGSVALTFLNLIAATMAVAFGNAAYSAAGVLNLLCFICIESSAFRSNGRGVYFVFVSLVGLVFSGGLLLAYLYHVVEKYHNFKWLKVEMVGSVALTFLNLIAATMAVAFGNAAYSAAGFFGYLAMVLYGADAVLRGRALQAGELAQGARVTTKQHLTTTTTTTPPALP